MATTLTIPNSFTNGVGSVAADVNANFTAVKDFINASVIATDVFLSLPTVPAGTDPTVNDHVARKLYVDNRVGFATALTVPTSGITTTTSYVTLTGSDVTIANPGKAVNVVIQACGFFGGGASSLSANAVKLQRSIAGAAYTDIQQCFVDLNTTALNPGITFGGWNVLDMYTGTPAGSIRYRLQIKATTTSAASTCFEPRMVYTMQKTVTV